MLESARASVQRVRTGTTSRMVTLWKILISGGEVRRENILATNEQANRKKLVMMTNHPVAATTGLCDSCKHVQLIKSDRGSVFYLCRLSASDARFPKYPRLPVLSCTGYEKDEGPATGTGD